jgi:protein-S-isoprenylcysteine O-methyltransferase Ste14
MKPIAWFGLLLALLGILGLAIPVFTTSQTKDIVRLGDLKIQNTERSTHVVPEALGAGLLVLGVILMGAGLYQRSDG